MKKLLHAILHELRGIRIDNAEIHTMLCEIWDQLRRANGEVI